MDCNSQRSGALHLTQKVDYGIMLLIALEEAQQENEGAIKSTSVNTMAKELNLSTSFLQKIAHLLQKSRLIKAQRGKYGGYKLTNPIEKTTIKDVIEALEGPIAIVPCIKNTNLCKRTTKCNIKKGLNKLNDEIQNFFLSKTIDQFIS